MRINMFKSCKINLNTSFNFGTERPDAKIFQWFFIYEQYSMYMHIIPMAKQWIWVCRTHNVWWMCSGIHNEANHQNHIYISYIVYRNNCVFTSKSFMGSRMFEYYPFSINRKSNFPQWVYIRFSYISLSHFMNVFGK